MDIVATWSERSHDVDKIHRRCLRVPLRQLCAESRHCPKRSENEKVDVTECTRTTLLVAVSSLVDVGVRATWPTWRIRSDAELVRCRQLDCESMQADRLQNPPFTSVRLDERVLA